MPSKRNQKAKHRIFFPFHPEGFTMEVLVSAVLGDIVSRSISFFVDRYRRRQTGAAGEGLERLRLLLLRVQTMVEEAERRHITNQAMLWQLDTLRHGMYRGYYVLDALTFRDHEEGDAMAKDEVSDDSFTQCRSIPAKRLCLSARTPKKMISGGKGLNELRKVISSLEMIVADMEEFVLFLKCYPPMCHKPCISSLSSDMCMFGRHTEYERIVSFLLQIDPLGTGNLSVLPIVGAIRVGKSTLVEHVCYDNRVRSYFSSIVFFTEDDLQGVKANVNALQESGIIKYRNGSSPGRLLIIIELVGDLEKEVWRRFCSLLGHHAHGSKVIVTSRSERIMRLGTTQTLKLNLLPQEAYWYFFKMIALRNAGLKDYQELSSIGMEIVAELSASFSYANMVGTFLRANLDACLWRKVLERIREHTLKYLLVFGEHPVNLLQKDRPVSLWRMTGGSEVLEAHRIYQVSSPQQKVPKLTVDDMVYGNAMPRGRFECLAWKSQIPPYYSYMVSCSIMAPQHMVVKKRSWLHSI